MFASNKAANYVLGFLGLVAFYFGYVYFPIYWDNVELKQAARVWVSASRIQEEQYEVKALREFKMNVLSLGLKLDDNACVYGRIDDTQGQVTCDYVRIVEFPLVDKTRPLRFRWTVTQRFRM